MFAVQEPKSVVDFTSVAVDTKVGELPALPAQTGAVYSDGSTSPVAVTWDPVTPDMVAKAGWFTATGTVAGTPLKPTAVVSVLDR